MLLLRVILAASALLGVGAAPALWFPLSEYHRVLSSSASLAGVNDSDAINLARVTQEWTYVRSQTGNYIACSTTANAEDAKSYLETTVNSDNAPYNHVMPFFNDQDADLSCYVVHASVTSEGSTMETAALLSYIEPIPVAAKVETDLVRYASGSGTVSLNSDKFGNASHLVVTVFPSELATNGYASNLISSMDAFLNDNEAIVEDNCNSSAGYTFCVEHFMSYAESLNETVLNANSCGFSSLPYQTGVNGVVTFDVSSLSGNDDCGLAMLVFLAFQKDVIFIEAMDPVQTYSNSEASWVVQSGATNSVPLYDLGISGQGQVIGISDTGVDENSCFFDDPNGAVADSQVGGTYTADSSKRKVVMYIAFQDGDDCNAGHGSHCAGSIAGNPGSTASTQDATGVARDAKLAVMDISQNCGGLALPTNMITGFLKPMHDTAQARIHSASWGSNTASYTYTSYQFDLFVYENPNHLVLIAAGNSGRNGLGSVGSPATFKNGLAVGASCSPDTNENGSPQFSSLGPTADGRLKPDIMAPGVSINSASAGPSGSSQTCASTFKSGTSMATPVAAGAAALLRQYLMEGRLPRHRSFTPSAALLKAMMINSATNVNRRYSGTCTGAQQNIDYGNAATPNEYQGFGRVTLQNVVPEGTNKGAFNTYVYDDENLSSFGSRMHEVKITAPSDGSTMKDLRITLVWTDPPATSAAGKILVHDLDLYVLGPTGTVTYANGRSSPDTLNNVERIQLLASSLTVGDTYLVNVTAKALVASQTQSYSLVITGNVETALGALGGDGGSGSSSSGSNVDIEAVAVFSTVFGVAVVSFAGWIVYRVFWRGERLKGFSEVSETHVTMATRSPQPNAVSKKEFVIDNRYDAKQQHGGHVI